MNSVMGDMNFETFGFWATLLVHTQYFMAIISDIAYNKRTHTVTFSWFQEGVSEKCELP